MLSRFPSVAVQTPLPCSTFRFYCELQNQRRSPLPLADRLPNRLPMQPSGIAGVHHTPKPPIRVNDQVFAAPILTGGCTSRTAGNDAPVLQPPQIGRAS